MSDISLSKAVRSNLLSLQNTATMMAKTQERLATGNKVNSALDNPTNYFTASALNSRAGDLNQLLDGMNNGIQTLQAADNGLKAITKTLESMQSTLRQARQDKSFQTQSFSIGTNATGSLNFTGGSIGTPEASLSLVKEGTAVQAKVGGAINAAAFDAIKPVAAAGDDVPATVTGGALDLGDFDGSELSFELSIGTTAHTITINTDSAESDASDIIADLQAAVDEAFGENVIVVGGDEDGLTFSEATGSGQALTVSNGSGASGVFGFTNGDAGSTNTGSADTALKNLSFSVNETNVVLTADNVTDLESAVTAINTQLAGTGVTAELDDDGNLVLVGAENGSNDIEVTGDDATALFGATLTSEGEAGEPTRSMTIDELVHAINRKGTDAEPNALYGKIRASNDKGNLRIENLSTTELGITGISSDGQIDGTSTEPVKIDGNNVRSDLAAQFRDLRDQLDKLADDASFNGINLLRGDNLQITFNETATSELNIRSKDEQGISSTVLKLATDLQASDLDSDANIDKLIGDVKTAINSVRSQSSAFGSSLSVVQNRQDFSKNMINTLQTGAANLTLADMNEEAANLLALQTRQSLSSSALSMASQADQSVLQLLR